MKNKIKENVLLSKILNKDVLTFCLMFISLFSMAVYTNIFTKNLINLNDYGFTTFKVKTLWLWFSLFWILLQLFILYLLPKKSRIITYLILNGIWVIVFFSQMCYVKELGKFMIFSDLFVAGEGLQYINSIFVNMDYVMYAISIINIGIMTLVYVINKGCKNEKVNKNKYLIIAFVVAIIFTRALSLCFLGKEETSDKWKENYNAKNIYLNYTNPNTSMYISGLYEYDLRAIYKYFYNLITLDKTILKQNIDEYNQIYGLTKQDNDYTGIFKDKNVIIVMMESIDSWIVDEDTMPTLYNIMNSSLNFTKRYSPFFNGGQTINSEFALNTGMYAISDRTTIYDLDEISYPYSFANMLKQQGYSVNSFHANTGSFYNRKNFHKLLGYDNHYSALDMQRDGLLDEDTNYFSDSELISDETLSNLILNKDEKFASFITTYSAHLEYTSNNRVYKTVDNGYKCSDDITEEECIYRTLANDTDKFLSILFQKLKDYGLYDNTIVVLASDHYVYGYSDSDYVASKKGVENQRKLLQNTPFAIWSSDMEHQDVDTIMDTADVLPTILNMLGIDYNPNNYMGTDVFSENHDDFVWFADNTYIADDKCSLSREAILTKVNYNIMKNKSILLTNYYGKE